MKTLSSSLFLVYLQLGLLVSRSSIFSWAFSAFGAHGISFRPLLSQNCQPINTPETDSTFAPPPPFLVTERILIHWKGEDKEAYSFGFRHDEFLAALEATTRSVLDVSFHNALDYTGHKTSNPISQEAYNQAMQYIDITFLEPSNTQALIQATVERCSLVHAAYKIVAETPVEEGKSSNAFEKLALEALENGAFNDMQEEKSNTTWSVRLRHYSNVRNDRRGRRARSMSSEREALVSLTPLLETFSGKVDLQYPDCKIYVLDGLLPSCQHDLPSESIAPRSSTLLTRRIAQGAQRLSSFNPNTRICVTNTPLCPTASVLLCNMARLRPHHRIWDPYVGSATILLAAKALEPTCTTLGTEISPFVNVTAMRQDFLTRGYDPPSVWIHGDCTDGPLRRETIGTVDVIVTDPPYGIRESMAERPIDSLLSMIIEDRAAGQRLLPVGGRLVLFLPHPHDQALEYDVLPRPEKVAQAGLRCEMYRGQKLNELLTRWLVSYVCVE